MTATDAAKVVLLEAEIIRLQQLVDALAATGRTGFRIEFHLPPESADDTLSTGYTVTGPTAALPVMVDMLAVMLRGMLTEEPTP